MKNHENFRKIFKLSRVHYFLLQILWKFFFFLVFLKSYVIKRCDWLRKLSFLYHFVYACVFVCDPDIPFFITTWFTNGVKDNVRKPCHENHCTISATNFYHAPSWRLVCVGPDIVTCSKIVQRWDFIVKSKKKKKKAFL